MSAGIWDSFYQQYELFRIVWPWVCAVSAPGGSDAGTHPQDPVYPWSLAPVTPGCCYSRSLPEAPGSQTWWISWTCSSWGSWARAGLLPRPWAWISFGNSSLTMLEDGWSCWLGGCIHSHTVGPLVHRDSLSNPRCSASIFCLFPGRESETKHFHHPPLSWCQQMQTW